MIFFSRFRQELTSGSTGRNGTASQLNDHRKKSIPSYLVIELRGKNSFEDKTGYLCLGRNCYLRPGFRDLNVRYMSR